MELAWPHGPDAYTLKPRDAAKRKVLIVTSWLEFGGAEKITGELVQALPDQQFEVTVVTTLDSPAPRFEYSLELIRDIFYLPNYFSKPEHIDALLLHIIQTRDIEVILINNSLVGYNMLPTVKELFPHIKALAILHSYVPELPWDFVRKSVETDSCIDQYLVSKQSLKATMETIFSVNPKKIQVFVSGVDTALFAPGNAEKIAKIKRQLQLEENMQIVSFISRLDYDKEPLKLISIVKHLMRYDPERRVCCMIVGDGVRKKELADEIRRQNLDHNVKFLGYRNDIPDMLKISDVLISTSPSEGIPITGLEAMATGVPVIAFDVPGWQELIQNGKDGILIPRSSVEEEQFALAIQQLLADPLRKTKLGIAGKQKVMRKHRLDQFRACIREAFERPPSSSAFAQVQRSPAQRSIVTIAIVAHNQAHTIKQAIDNVITQTIPNWNLFIVNDASTDHTEAIIRPYLRDSRVRLISNEERQGYGKCLDTMIAKTKTPYFLLHDAEEWLEADAVQYMLGKALMLPDHVAGFCGNVRIWIDKADHKEIIKGDRFSDPWELLLADPCIWPCFFRTSVLKRLQGRKADLETDNQYLAQLRLLIHLLESYDLHWIDNLVSNHRVRYDRTASKLRELSMANRASLKLALRDISPYGLHQ
ncbi:glycosyltransferase [Paenibacillus doosanensis]|uniref:glycosyltransferase n=1 Tax=Paenibacillus doosanensis TaxID=1229154 RepID=UPI00217FD8EF|nr:glycosyltransferase [Paenibacillus doosanensis]MCS7459354.1 glycosyltransferase [Paenibacillus doosanensis]